MRLSYPIGKVFGISIEMHLLFILFILAVLLINPLLSYFLIIIFLFVTLHEISHSIVSTKEGVKVSRIVLLPIGGVSMIESAQIDPKKELKIAIAGPLFNFAMILICLFLAALFKIDIIALIKAFNKGLPLDFLSLTFLFVFYANAILGGFNLFVPAFPLDGGRILRAALAMKMDSIKATEIAKNISFVIAGAMFFLGMIFGDLWIMVIAFFIIFGAIGEYQSLILQKVLSKIKISSLISKHVVFIQPTKTLLDAFQTMKKNRETSAIVTSRPYKVISLAIMAHIPREIWGDVKVGKVARKVRASIHTPLEKIVRIMEANEVDIVPLFEDRRFVGVVKREDIEKALKFEEIA